MIVVVNYSNSSRDVFFGANIDCEDRIFKIDYHSRTHYENYMAIKTTEDEMYVDKSDPHPIVKRLCEEWKMEEMIQERIRTRFSCIMVIPVDKVISIECCPETVDEVKYLHAVRMDNAHPVSIGGEIL